MSGRSHFLKPALLRRCAVDYWSFREDVSGFERIFSKHGDEFAGEPRRANEIQTLYFPLRGPDRRILATVTLSSPSLTERLTTFREDMLLGFFALLIGSLLVLLFGRPVLAPFPPREKAGARSCPSSSSRPVSGPCSFPLSRLERVQSLSVFSPAGAGFFSIGGLTRSPADIFLTSAAVALVVGCLMALGLAPARRETPARRSPLPPSRRKPAPWEPPFSFSTCSREP